MRKWDQCEALHTGFGELVTPWCSALRRLRDGAEKGQAFAGLVRLVQLNPAGKVFPGYHPIIHHHPPRVVWSFSPYVHTTLWSLIPNEHFWFVYELTTWMDHTRGPNDRWHARIGAHDERHQQLAICALRRAPLQPHAAVGMALPFLLS